MIGCMQEKDSVFSDEITGGSRNEKKKGKGASVVCTILAFVFLAAAIVLSSLVNPAFLYFLFGFFASLVAAIEIRDSRNQANASHMGHSNDVGRFHEKTEEREKTEKKSEEIGNRNGLDGENLIENSNNKCSKTSKKTVNRQEEEKKQV